MNSSKIIFGLLLIIVGFCMLCGQLNIHPELSSGDNGRDLYAIQQTSQGATPYKDYWWVYGPLMPYYYALFFLLLGGTIKSVLWGYLFLKIISGLLFFLILSEVILPLFAFLGAIWFWTFNPDFTYTFNHIGATTTILAIVYCNVVYIRSFSMKWIWGAIGLSMVCAFIKLNIGLAVLLATLVCFLLSEKIVKPKNSQSSRLIYIFGCFAVPWIIFIVYWLFLKDLDIYEIRQCLPYLASDRPIHTPMMEVIKNYLKYTLGNIVATPQNLIFGLVIVLCMIQTVLMLSRHNRADDKKKQRIMGLSIVGIFLLIIFHEYLLSGVAYRSSWIVPFQFLFIYLFLGIALEPQSKKIRILLASTLFMTALFQTNNVYQIIRHFSIPSQYLSNKNAQIFVTNSGQWIRVVTQTLNYLKKQLREDETFLAIPYDPLYYYLAQKKSPTRLLIFFNHINIPTEQEKEIIENIKDHKTKYIIVSNRSDSEGRGMGTFGQSYLVEVAKYLFSHYELVETFGPWEQPPGVTQNHAIKIYKLKDSF